jgi:ADP-ribosylation factor-binding protein GGA
VQGYTLKLKPQTGRNLAPNQKTGIAQEILLGGVPLGKGNAVKMRYKVSYQRDGEAQEEQGNVPSLGIS